MYLNDSRLVELLQRCDFEYQRAVSNLAFLMDEMAKTENGAIWLESKLYHELFGELEKKLASKVILEQSILRCCDEGAGARFVDRYRYILVGNDQFKAGDHGEDFTEQVYRMWGVKSRTFTFQVTENCNLACLYCYQGCKSTKHMDFDVAKSAVDWLITESMKENGWIGREDAIILEFIGGEPFLEIELISEIVSYFRRRVIEERHPWSVRFMISICSNGVLYNDTRVQEFLRRNADILSFSVTVDGTEELHNSCRVFPGGKGSWQLAHDAVKDWMDKGYYMGSKVTIAPGNIEYLADSLMAMVRDGFYDINANCVYENVWSAKHAAELYRQIVKFTDTFLREYDAGDYRISLLDAKYGKPLSVQDNDNWCGGTGAMLAMDWKGDFYPCLRYMASSLGAAQKAYVIGDVKHGVGSDEEQRGRIECMEQVTRRSQSADHCFYCPIASGCSWCSAYNYQCFGTVNKRTTYICEMHKARTLGAVYFWNSYFKKKGLSQVVNLWVPQIWGEQIIGKMEYSKLVDLVFSLGGSVNKTRIMVGTSTHE